MVGIGDHARAAPDAAALVTLTTTRTYGELEERQEKLAGVLRAGGVGKGDRIAVLSANRTELLEVTTGALRAGIVPIPIHATLTNPEISFILEDSGARWLITDRGVDLPLGLDRVVTFGDAYERELHEASLQQVADVTLTRPMHYTSGTTGKPKGVWVRPRSEGEGASRSRGFSDTWALGSDDIHLVCSPLSHSAPHRFALRTLESGGTVIIQERFQAEETLAAIALFSATTTFMVPTHLERIFSLEERIRRRYDVSSIRLLAHAGAPIREETKRRTIEFFPHGSVWEFYGSTEGQATRISAEEWLRKVGSVGTALGGARILICDPEGAPVPPGEVGEVWIADPEAERFEYWGDVEKTRAAWREGAFTVGDLGRIDEDGYLFLTGRKHDTIITGGVNVYPQEVEATLLEHPAVAEALVYGEPHDEWGQEVRALIVPSVGAPLDPDALRAWARQRLAGFKCPRRIAAVESLPRTPTGKLLREPSD
ncbi:MAG: AMP-binding protein [Actinomycetota bacterium]